MWYQLRNKNYAQMIDKPTLEEAVARFHQVLDGEGALYTASKTTHKEVVHKFGASELEGDVAVRFNSIRDVEKHNAHVGGRYSC